MRPAVQEREVGMAVQLDVRVQATRLPRVARRQMLGIANFSWAHYLCRRPRRKRSRDLAPAARQASEPARRAGGVISFSAGSVIDPLHEPLVTREVVVQLT